MWDQRYSSDTFVYGTKPNDFLAEQAHRIPAGTVLCLAEGEGRNAVHLAGLGFEVHAVDLSSVGRNKALKLAQQTGVDIRYDVGDLAHLKLGENRWSGIISIFAHTPSTLRRQLHGKIAQALKPGGVFILEGFSLDQLASSGTGGPQNPDMLMSLHELREELSELDLQIAQEGIRRVDEGELHQGECCVVQIVAVKA